MNLQEDLRKKINEQYRNLDKALVGLKEATEDLKTIHALSLPTCGPFQTQMLRTRFSDSVIKRFNYTFEGLWEYLQNYYNYELGITDAYGPKQLIRAGCLVRIISEEEGSLLMEMTECRAQTFYGYGKEPTEILSGKIVQYYPVLERIVKRTKP